MNWLIKQKVIHFYQTAYGAQHSTVDQLFYLGLITQLLKTLPSQIPRLNTRYGIEVFQAYEEYSAKGFKEAQCSSKTLRFDLGSKPKPILNIYTALIRPILEYAAPIWSSSASISTEKIDSIQHRASKIIIGAVCSTNNVTAEKKCGLTSSKARNKLGTIKFINKISCVGQHISNITFRSWTAKNRLRRSSTFHFDKDIRIDINLNHTSLDIIKEPCFPV
ncbi:RNase H domain-containing protein [Trichonephila clavipes]|nr:RNase H domain-containing protein [Trichonephila clavipes]